MPYVFAVRGKKKSGKTTLVLKLVERLTGRGLRVACVKHVHHAGFELDTPDTDSYRMGHAGAELVAVASQDETGFLLKTPMEPDAAVRLAGELSGADVVLVEGWRAYTCDGIDLEEERPDLERLVEEIAAKTASA